MPLTSCLGGIKVLNLAKWGYLKKGLLIIWRTWIFSETLLSTRSLEICSQKSRDTATATVLLIWIFEKTARAAPNRSPTQMFWRILLPTEKKRSGLSEKPRTSRFKNILAERSRRTLIEKKVLVHEGNNQNFKVLSKEACQVQNGFDIQDCNSLRLKDPVRILFSHTFAENENDLAQRLLKILNKSSFCFWTASRWEKTSYNR